MGGNNPIRPVGSGNLYLVNWWFWIRSFRVGFNSRHKPKLWIHAVGCEINPDRCNGSYDNGIQLDIVDNIRDRLCGGDWSLIKDNVRSHHREPDANDRDGHDVRQLLIPDRDELGINHHMVRNRSDTK